MPAVLKIRKLADTSDGTRVTRFDPVTGEKFLADPETGEPKPWPLAGVTIEGDVPDEVRLPTSTVDAGRREGWIVVEGESVVHRAGGPPSNPWAITHTFRQADAITLKLADGDVRYRVVHQPDKYDDEAGPSGKRVDWFYDLALAKEV